MYARKGEMDRELTDICQKSFGMVGCNAEPSRIGRTDVEKGLDILLNRNCSVTPVLSQNLKFLIEAENIIKTA